MIKTAAAPARAPVLGPGNHHHRHHAALPGPPAQALTEEAAEHEKAILTIVRSWRPDLLDQLGVGPIVAATVLCAWSHPGRIHSEAAFAMLAGAARSRPPAARSPTATDSTATATANSTAPCTPSPCPGSATTRPPATYVERRTAEGKTPREIKRCLKRYIARDLYRLLETGPTTA